MVFTAIHPTTGARERRRHVPYRLTQSGTDWLAFHKETGRKLGRFDSEAIAVRALNSMTEPA